MRETREQIFKRIHNDPAFEYIIERVIIALAPIFEEVEELNHLLDKAKKLAKLHEDDLKVSDDDIDADYSVRIAELLAGQTSVDEVRALLKQHGAKKISKLKPKQLIAFTREVQYKLSYLKTMSNK